VLELAASAQCLKALVHVSSAYVNINKPRGSVVDEQIYPLHLGKQAVDAEQIVKVGTGASRVGWVGAWAGRRGGGGPEASSTGRAAACVMRLTHAYMVEPSHTAHGVAGILCW
jgi:hypothetical protein